MTKFLYKRKLRHDKIKCSLSLRPEGEETVECRYVCRPQAENFDILSDDHGRTRKCDFSVFSRKYPFWENLVMEIKLSF